MKEENRDLFLELWYFVVWASVFVFASPSLASRPQGHDRWQ